MIRDGNSPYPKWITLHPSITSVFIEKVADNSIRNADVILYTWWSLTPEIVKLSGSKGQKFNLIQGYEVWNGYEEMVHSSYNHESVRYICISEYLYNIISKFNAYRKPDLLSLAVSDTFTVLNKIENRDPFSVAMLYSHLDHIKGSVFGLEAFKILKKSYPQMTVTLFGVGPRDQRIPSWIGYYQNPQDLPALYNESAIFLSPSLTEGWALPPVEAMKCGCAFVGSNIPGHKAYLKEGCNLAFEPGSVTEIVEKISFLFNNSAKRIEYAKESVFFVRQFGWDETIKKLNQLLSPENKIRV